MSKYKYIRADVLLEMFRDDEMLSCDRPFDIYQWAANIVDECPAVENMVSLPVRIGQIVWRNADTHGVVESFYFGINGLQRFFVKFDNGEKMNFSPKCIGKDIFFEKPPF